MIPVMIVEDEFLVRLGLKSLIDWNAYGFQIVADASDGQSALRLYQQYKPYLILTDIRMEPMDGLALMEEIRRQDPDVKFIIISAYSDFAYAQKAISFGVELYLSKSTLKNEELVQVLPRIRAAYEATHEKITGKDTRDIPEFETAFSDASDLSGIEKQLRKIQLSGNSLAVIACRFPKKDASHHTAALLQTVFQNQMDAMGTPCKLYRKQQFLLCVCGTSRQDALVPLLSGIHTTLLNYTSRHCYFGVSAVFQDLRHLFHGVSEACLACNELIIHPQAYIHLFTPSCIQIDFGEANLDIEMEKLMTSVFSSHWEESLDILKQIMGSCKNYRSLEKAVFTVLFSFIEYDNSSMLSSLLERHLRTDELRETIDSLLEWIYALPFHTMTTDNSSKYIDTVVGYIKAHPEENLSIQFLADLVHLSPNYLGKIFYQKTGSLLNSYITNYRINKACDLLLHTDYPVNTVGAMVGIGNPHYFSRVFRDTVGMSPSKYRAGDGNKRKEGEER